MFDPITHADGTQYDVMIPEEVVLEGDSPMPMIYFTSDDGDTFGVTMFRRQVLALRDELVRAFPLDALVEADLIG